VDDVEKAPSFKGLKPASSRTSRVKKANRASDTMPEVILRRELWRLGLRYNKCPRDLPGKPDLAFRRSKVAVFCDGDFWHGRNWATLKEKLENGTNSAYWPAKIARNIQRDATVNVLLEQLGWQVIRVWETDVKRHPEVAAQVISNAVRSRR